MCIETERFRRDGSQGCEPTDSWLDRGQVARGQWRVLVVHRVPVHSVQIWFEEVIANVGPGLLKDFHLFARKVDVQLSGHGGVGQSRVGHRRWGAIIQHLSDAAEL